MVKEPANIPYAGGGKLWTRSLITLAASVFLLSLGIGLQSGVSTNFIKDIGLSGSQVLLQAGIREIPGLFLMFIAALIMHLPLKWRSVAAVLIMGAGFTLYATVHSWSALVVVSLIGSLGMHLWMPLNNSLGLGIAKKENSGKVLGTLSAVAALASMAGIGSIILLTHWLSLRLLIGVAGGLIVLAAIVLMRLPQNIGETKKAQPRLLFKKRYWVYYVLLLFEGSRTQVFFTFNTMVLVYTYGLSAMQISILLLVSSLVNFLLSQKLGQLLDVIGERKMLTIGYIALILCFVGYALVNQVWFLGLMLVFINFLGQFSIGLSTYVNRVSPPEELTPTLSTGVSINHVTSVGMSFLAGALLPVVGYKALCWGAVVLIGLSVPFAMALRIPAIKPEVEKTN
jgi:predicted MFS family arabinose efflux permease